MLMKTKTLFIAGLCMAASVANAQTEAKTYDFTKFTQEQIAEFEEAVSDGTWGKQENIYKNMTRIGANSHTNKKKVPITVQNIVNYGGKLTNKEGKEFTCVKGLLFGIYLDENKQFKAHYPNKKTHLGSIWFVCTPKKTNAIRLNGNNFAIVIPNLKKGMQVSVSYRASNGKDEEFLSGYNFDSGNTFVQHPGEGKNTHVAEGKVAEDGAAWFVTTNGGAFIYDITIKDKDGNVITTGIDNITQVTQDNKVYDLNGHYMGNNVNALQHGMYILNGKKIIK